jgi:hypothetical protein
VNIPEQHDGKGQPAPTPAALLSSAGAARRRFGRAGVGVSGVVLTLVSQPGMASPLMCTSASGSLSHGLSSKPANAKLVCAGVSPGFWKSAGRTWPAPCTREKLFSSVFPHGGTSLYQTGSMLAMLTNNDPSKDPYNLGMHLVATYLNVLSGKISFLTVDGLKKMWNDLVTYGHYVPSAGYSWTALDVKNYLQSTHD